MFYKLLSLWAYAFASELCRVLPRWWTNRLHCEGLFRPNEGGQPSKFVAARLYRARATLLNGAARRDKVARLRTYWLSCWRLLVKMMRYRGDTYI